MRSTANHRTGGKRSPAIRPVPPSTRQHSAAWGLALFYAGLIVYASLYPFAPWSSNGLPWWGFVSHPWPRYWTGFDITANLLGYMPMGFLVALAALRDRGGRLLPRAAVPLGIFLCALLSFAAESLQNWLPQRVPSNVDWLLNTLGGSLGSLLAWGMGKAGALNAWSRMRQHWFVPDAQEGLVLLLLWPWALLSPARAVRPRAGAGKAGTLAGALVGGHAICPVAAGAQRRLSDDADVAGDPGGGAGQLAALSVGVWHHACVAQTGGGGSRAVRYGNIGYGVG